MTHELILHENWIDKILVADALPLIKFNHGKWTIGKGSENIPANKRYAVMTPTLWWGWTRWEDGYPVERRGGYAIQGHKDLDPKRDRKNLGYNNEDEWEINKFNGRPADP
jgi:hypothetical protein